VGIVGRLPISITIHSLNLVAYAKNFLKKVVTFFGMTDRR